MNCKNCGKAVEVNHILCDECFDDDEIFHNVVIQPLLDDERDSEIEKFYEPQPTTQELVELYQHDRNCDCPHCSGDPEEYADNPDEKYGENGIGHIAPTDGYWSN